MPQTRQQLADRLVDIGNALKDLRMDTVEEGHDFVGGLLRAAEETTLVAYQILTDPNVRDKDL